MAVNIRSGALLVGLACALLTLAPARAQIVDYSPTITVDGLVAGSRTYDVDALRALPATEVYIQGLDVPDTRSYRGVTLYDLLVDADPQFDPDHPTDALNWYALVSAGSDRSVIVAWAEIDPMFEGKPVLVAYERDGQPLPLQQGMAQLIVPFDRRTTRAIANVRTISLQRPQIDPSVDPDAFFTLP